MDLTAHSRELYGRMDHLDVAVKANGYRVLLCPDDCCGAILVLVEFGLEEAFCLCDSDVDLDPGSIILNRIVRDA